MRGEVPAFLPGQARRSGRERCLFVWPSKTTTRSRPDDRPSELGGAPGSPTPYALTPKGTADWICARRGSVGFSRGTQEQAHITALLADVHSNVALFAGNRSCADNDLVKVFWGELVHPISSKAFRTQGEAGAVEVCTTKVHVH